MKIQLKHLIGVALLAIVFYSTATMAVTINSTFLPGQTLTAAAMNEIRSALISLPEWRKGVDEHSAVFTSGNVGIHTTSPQEALEVNGTVQASKFVGDGSGLANLPGLLKHFTTGDRSFETNTLYSFAHSLGGPPKMAVFELVCIRENYGYKVGDRVPILNFAAANSGIRTAGYNDTEVFVRIGDNGYGSILGPKAGRSMMRIPDPANWKINVHAWR